SVFGVESDRVRLAPIPDWVASRPDPELDATVPDAERHGIYYLLVDRQFQAESNEVYCRLVYTITSTTGVQQGSQFSASFAPDFQWIDLHRLRIWRNGVSEDRLALNKMQLLQQERDLDRYQYNGQLTALFLLEDVRVGDVVECAY